MQTPPSTAAERPVLTMRDWSVEELQLSRLTGRTRHLRLHGATGETEVTSELAVQLAPRP